MYHKQSSGAPPTSTALLNDENMVGITSISSVSLKQTASSTPDMSMSSSLPSLNGDLRVPLDFAFFNGFSLSSSSEFSSSSSFSSDESFSNSSSSFSSSFVFLSTISSSASFSSATFGCLNSAFATLFFFIVNFSAILVSLFFYVFS